MGKYQDYVNLNLTDVSDNDLEFMYGELVTERDEYVEAWANDAAALVKNGTDPYSFFGERKLKKLAKKFASPVADIEILMEDIDKELDKREKIAEEDRYNGRGAAYADETKEEFLEREGMKTQGFRKGNK